MPELIIQSNRELLNIPEYHVDCDAHGSEKIIEDQYHWLQAKKMISRKASHILVAYLSKMDNKK